MGNTLLGFGELLGNTLLGFGENLWDFWGRVERPHTPGYESTKKIKGNL